jgi:hypothetical protein
MESNVALLNLCQQALKFNADIAVYLKKHDKEELLFSKFRRSVDAVTEHIQHAVHLTELQTTEISNEERDHQVRSNIDNALSAAKRVEYELSFLLSKRIVKRKEMASVMYKLEDIIGGLKIVGGVSDESQEQGPQDL